MTAIASPAQTFTTLANFQGKPNANPFDALVQGTDGNLYGTTDAPWWSTVFKITPAGKLITLHKFDGTDGSGPYAGLVLATDDSFYGTTTYGGANNSGTVFKITPKGTLTTLYSFPTNCANGQGPYAGLVQAADELTRRQARKRAEEHLRPLNLGKVLALSNLPFRVFIERHFVPNVFPTLKLSTQGRYRCTLNTHLLPAFGDSRLCDIGTIDLQHFVLQKMDGGLSWATCDHLRN